MSPKITILLCVGAFFVKNAYCQHGNPGYIKTGAYGSPGIPCGPSANLAPNSPPYMAAQLAIPTGETLAIPTGVNLAIPITECAGYSGTGVGDVVVTGEMPVEGITLVTGQVPIIGSVRFAGDVSASGIVSALGTCGCGCGLGNAFVS